jgi:hypothetical protein
MKHYNPGLKYALIIIGLFIVALLVMDFNDRMADLRRLSNQQERIAAELTALIQTKSHLETQIAYATSDAVVYEWAYQDGHWVREGDYPIVPLPQPGFTPQPTPTVIITAEPLSNWQVWLSLFTNLP